MSKAILELRNVKTIVNKGTSNETTILKGTLSPLWEPTGLVSRPS